MTAEVDDGARRARPDRGRRRPRCRSPGRSLAEALRLYPPAWSLGRRLVADVQVDGWTMPAGSLVVASQWVLHRDPRFWPDAHRFVPERWLTPTAGSTRRRRGSRAAPGSRSGSASASASGSRSPGLEGVLVLAAIAARWQVDVDPGVGAAGAARRHAAPARTGACRGATALLAGDRSAGVPVRRSRRARARPRRPGPASWPSAAGTTCTPRANDSVSVPAQRLLQRFEQQRPRLGQPAADRDGLQVEQVGGRRDAHPDRAAGSAQGRAARPGDRVGRRRPGRARSGRRRRRRPVRPSRCPAPSGPGWARWRPPRGSRARRTRRAARPARRRRARCGRRCRRRRRPGGRPGPGRRRHRSTPPCRACPAAAPRAAPVLADRHADRVVVQAYGDVREPLGHPGPQRELAPARDVQRGDLAGRPRHRSPAADAHAVEAVRWRRAGQSDVTSRSRASHSASASARGPLGVGALAARTTRRCRRRPRRRAWCRPRRPPARSSGLPPSPPWRARPCHAGHPTTPGPRRVRRGAERPRRCARAAAARRSVER